MLGEVVKEVALGAWEKYGLWVKIIVALAIVATIVVLVLMVRSLRRQLAESQATVATAVSANERQTTTIHELEVQRAKDATAIQGLEVDKANLQTANLSAQRCINDLEKTDDTVRTYLNTPVPPGIASVLADQGGHADGDVPDRPSGASPGGVHTPGSGSTLGKP